MWRLLQRRPPASSLLSRTPSGSLPTGQQVYLQRVKFKYRFRPMHIIGAVTAAYIGASVFQSIVLAPIAKTLDETVTDEEKDEIDDVFIPLPFMIRAVQSEPYSGQDPEWLAFVATSKDKDLQMKIRTEIAHIVCRVIEANPLITRRYGNNWKVRRYWSDVDYPFRPPPKFLRLGIDFFAEDGFKTVEKEMDSRVAQRVRWMLWPTPVAMSTLSFAGTLLKQNLLEAAKYLGYQAGDSPEQPSSTVQAMHKTVESLQQQATKEPGAVKDPSAMAKQKTPGGAPGAEGTDSVSRSAASTPANKTPPPTPPTTPDTSLLDPDKRTVDPNTIFPYTSVRSHIDGAWNSFRQTLSKTWRRPQDFPPRGCVLVSGLVELESDKAYLVVDVYAWWDPKTRSYDYKSMKLGLRRFQPKQQSPLR